MITADRNLLYIRSRSCLLLYVSRLAKITLSPHDMIQCHNVGMVRGTCYVLLLSYVIPASQQPSDVGLDRTSRHTEKSSSQTNRSKIDRGIYRSLCNVLTTSAIWWSALCHHNMTLYYVIIEQLSAWHWSNLEQVLPELLYQALYLVNLPHSAEYRQSQEREKRGNVYGWAVV